MIIKMFNLKDYATTELCNKIKRVDLTDLLDGRVIVLTTQQQRVM